MSIFRAEKNFIMYRHGRVSEGAMTGEPGRGIREDKAGV